jgi:AhpD family alkylhydroperoxidase
MGRMLDEFNAYRDRMNQKILEQDNKVIKRAYSIDKLTYRDGALSGKTKEMLGLVASMVLRCDDCIKYHILKCHQCGVTKDEFFEIFSIAIVVGGSIVIPDLRKSVEFLEDIIG